MYGSEPDNTWHAKQAILEEKRKNALNGLPTETYKNIINHIPDLVFNPINKYVAFGGGITLAAASGAAAGEDNPLDKYSQEDINELVYSLASQGISPQILSGIPQVADAIEAYSNAVIANSLNQQLVILAEVSNTAQKEVAKEEAAQERMSLTEMKYAGVKPSKRYVPTKPELVEDNRTDIEKLADCLKFSEGKLQYKERYEGVFGTGSAGTTFSYKVVKATTPSQKEQYIYDLKAILDVMGVPNKLVMEADMETVRIPSVAEERPPQYRMREGDTFRFCGASTKEIARPLNFWIEYQTSEGDVHKSYLGGDRKVHWTNINDFSDGISVGEDAIIVVSSKEAKSSSN